MVSLKRIGTFFIDTGIDLWKLAAMFALSFTAPFMLLFYSPFDIYLHNPSAFVIGWRFFLPYLFAFSIIGTVLMFITLLLVCHKKIILGISVFALGIAAVLFARFSLHLFLVLYLYAIAAMVIALIFYVLLKTQLKDKATDIILLLVLGVVLSAYVQTLFLNGNMVATAGASPHYSALSLANIVNLLVWAAVTLLPLGLWVCLRAAKKNFMFEKAIVFSAVIISGMQIAGLATAAASTELPRGLEEQPPKYVSFYNALNLSSDKNILVFVLDRLDARFMRDAFEEHPYLKDVLYGFTHFDNNVAAESFYTLPSMVTLLTQHKYREGQIFAEFWEEAWAQHNIIDTLREHGFTTNLYIDQWSTISSLSDIESRTDNIRYAYGGFDAYLETSNFASVISRMSLGRVSPYLLKNAFLANIHLDFGNHFVSFTYEMADAQPVSVGPYHDNRFLEFIRQNEFTADIENGVFQLIHLNGAHAGGESVNIPSIVQNFEILNHYFGNMRELGVFDSSTIIVVGDHGYYYAGLPVAVSLFIKPAGGAGELVTDSVTEMTDAYFAASILQAAGLPHGELGLSYFDILEGATAPTRTVNHFSSWAIAFAQHGAQGYMTLYGVFEIMGYAGDADNWVFIPNTG